MADHADQKSEAPLEGCEDGGAASFSAAEEEGVVARLRRVPLVASLAERVGGAYVAVRGRGGLIGAACGVAETGVSIAAAVAATSARPIAWALQPQLVKAERLAVKGVDFLETKLPLLTYSDREAPESARPAVVSAVGSAAGAVASALSAGMSASRTLLQGLSHTQAGHKLLAGLDYALCHTEDYIDCYLTASDCGEAGSSRECAHPMRRVVRLAGRVARGLYRGGARAVRRSCSGFEQREPSDGQEATAPAAAFLPPFLSKALSPAVWLASRSASAVSSAFTAVANRVYDHAINNSSLNWVMRKLGLCEVSPRLAEALDDGAEGDAVSAHRDGGVARSEGNGHPLAVPFNAANLGERLAPVSQDPDCFALQPAWRRHHLYQQQVSPNRAF